jgi:sortase A
MRLIPRRRLIFLVVLGFGLWQVAAGLWIPAKAWLAQRLIAEAWDDAMATRGPVAPWPWADTTPVARLVVPALGVDQIVLAHATGRTLAFGPGHLDGSPAPGAAGLSVISGHRDTSFRFLADVVPGTTLRIQRADGAWVDYVIREIEVVDERTARLPLVGNGPPQLALTTCYPFAAVMPGGTLRLVALAEAVPMATMEQHAAR